MLHIALGVTVACDLSVHLSHLYSLLKLFCKARCIDNRVPQVSLCQTRVLSDRQS